MLSFQWPGPSPNSFVQITSRAKFEDDVNVSICLKGVDQIHNIGMGTKASVASQLFGTFINGKGAIRVVGCGLLCQALNSHKFVCGQVLGHKDHAK
jgi:hypothetical protein